MDSQTFETPNYDESTQQVPQEQPLDLSKPVAARKKAPSQKPATTALPIKKRTVGVQYEEQEQSQAGMAAPPPSHPESGQTGQEPNLPAPASAGPGVAAPAATLDQLLTMQSTGNGGLNEAMKSMESAGKKTLLWEREVVFPNSNEFMDLGNNYIMKVSLKAFGIPHSDEPPVKAFYVSILKMGTKLEKPLEFSFNINSAKRLCTRMPHLIGIMEGLVKKLENMENAHAGNVAAKKMKMI